MMTVEEAANELLFSLETYYADGDMMPIEDQKKATNADLDFIKERLLSFAAQEAAPLVEAIMGLSEYRDEFCSCRPFRHGADPHKKKCLRMRKALTTFRAKHPRNQ